MIRVLAIVAMMVVRPGGIIYGQHEVSGIIMNESLVPVVGAQIYVGDTRQPMATTGLNGRFDVELSSLEDTLRASFTGFETAEIVLSEDCDSLFIPLQEMGLYHYKSTRKINRLRKKRFDELSSVHPQAYSAGFAKRLSPCYNRLFYSTKKELDQIKEEVKIVKRDQRKKYGTLSIGDTVSLQFGSTYQYDGTDRTALHLYSMLIDRPKSKCAVTFVLKKIRRKSTILEAIDVGGCTAKHPMFYDQMITKGAEIEVDLRYVHFEFLE